MSGMPYVMEKGPVFSVYEDYVSSLQRRLALLESVADVTVPMWDVLALDSKSLGGNPQALKDHTRDDWHGNPSWDQTSGTWKQIPGEKQTGDWIRWVGPAESIVRQTFHRAIEVSLGIEHKPIAPKPGGTLRHPSPTQLHPTPGPLQRCWPIEILWVCGSPSMQGWVTWRQHGPGWGEGQVTLVFATPGYEGSALYPGPEAPAANQTADYKLDPGSWDDVAAERGMWVIGAKTTVEVIDTTDWVDASFDPPGPAPRVTWRYPTSRQVSSGPVLTVRPSEVDGGVRNTARRYVP